MQEKEMTTEMIEFLKSVEQLWASCESLQQRFYEDEPANAKHIHTMRYRSFAGEYSGINHKQAQSDDMNIAL
ncbi:MAG: hypothetical protein R6W75_03585 [Smithellaceae bacterium]